MRYFRQAESGRPSLMRTAALVAHSAHTGKGTDARMGLFSTMHISGSALTAQRLRMDVIAGNIANAETTRINGQRQPFQRQQVVFQPLNQGLGSGGQGLQVASIVKDQSASRQV